MINQANSRNGGGSSFFTAPNFVAKNISKELADRLLSNTIQPYIQNLVVYVGTNGNDGMADGTQEKPFLTIQSAMKYIAKTYGCLDAYKVTIRFTTDFNMDNASEPLTLTTPNSCYEFQIDGSSHSVILSPVVTNNQHGVFLSNLTIKHTAKVDNRALLDNHSSYTKIANINFISSATCKATHLINSRYNTFLECQGNNNITVTEGASIEVVIDIYNSSSLMISSSGSNSTTCNGKANKLIRVRNSSSALILAPFKGTFTGKKYEIAYGSALNLNSKGESLLIGTEAGTKDETSIIC